MQNLKVTLKIWQILKKIVHDRNQFLKSCCVANSFPGILGNLRGQLLTILKWLLTMPRAMRLISFVYVATRDHKKMFFLVIENDHVCSKCHLNKLRENDTLKIGNACALWKVLSYEKCKFNIKNTKMKIEKSETNFHVWILILYQFLNFDFRFSNLIFIFWIHRVYSKDFHIRDLNQMKTLVNGTV